MNRIVREADLAALAVVVVRVVADHSVIVSVVVASAANAVAVSEAIVSVVEASAVVAVTVVVVRTTDGKVARVADLEDSVVVAAVSVTVVIAKELLAKVVVSAAASKMLDGFAQIQ